MASVKVKMNSSGVVALMKSAQSQNHMLKIANRIKDRANAASGRNFKADVRAGKSRAVAMVKSGDLHTAYSERKHGWIMRALGGG